jgi:uncharacterized membrane protein
MKNQFDELTKGLAQSVRRRQAFKKCGVGLVGLALACFAPATTARAGDPTYTPVDYPGSVFTLAAGINSGGDIVGRYIDTAGVNHGFRLSGGNFTSLDFPGAALTRPVGINDHGDIVGHYSLQGEKKNHAFLLSGGTFTTVDFPDAEETLAMGINSNGDISGYYRGKKDDWHGFVRRAGVFTSIDYPRAKYTEAWRINDSGEIAGRYAGADGNFHLFKLSSDVFVSLDYPGAVQTAPGAYSHVGGLNNVGDVTSDYASDAPFQNLDNPNVIGNIHGFVLSQGGYTSFDFLGAFGTIAFGINDAGLIVGGYIDAHGVHGYLRTP